MEKYYTIHEFSDLLGVSTQTLRNWDKNGKLHPHHTSSSGYRYYSKEQLDKVMKVNSDTNKITIGYCRVKSKEQMDELDKQIEYVTNYLIAQGKPFEIISDISPGVDYRKKGLMELMRKIVENKVEKVVVLQYEILIQFGFEWIEYFAVLHGCGIEIINHTKGEDRDGARNSL